MQLAMLLLMVGTLLVFAGRMHILTHSGIPPRTWLVMEAILSSGPAFGWFALSFGGSTLAIALSATWAFVGILSYFGAHVFVRQCLEKQQETSKRTQPREPFDDEPTNPMAKALSRFNEVDRTIDFDALGEEQEKIARIRRKRLSASG